MWPLDHISPNIGSSRLSADNR